MKADFLSLDLARIAGHQTRLAQKRLERGGVLDQGTRQAVAHGPRLSELASSCYGPHDVELAQLVGQYERLTHNHLPGFTREVVVRRAIVHDKIAFAWLDEHARHGTFASAGPVIILSDHALISSARGCCAA